MGVAPADLWIVTGVTVVLLGLVFFLSAFTILVF